MKKLKIRVADWLLKKFDLHTRKSLEQHMLAVAFQCGKQIEAAIVQNEQCRSNPKELEAIGPLPARHLWNWSHGRKAPGLSSYGETYKAAKPVARFTFDKIGNF